MAANGVVLWEGKGFGGKGKVAAIATGTVKPSQNRKVGWSVQVWILDRNRDPVSAVYGRKDQSVCGRCSLRSGKGCYVNVGRAPLAVWKAYKKQHYPYWNNNTRPFRSKFIRWGAYGDPALIPPGIVNAVNAVASGRTGFTRLWDLEEYQDRRAYLMASVDSLAGLEKARALGWKTYRILPNAAEKRADEFICPASKEMGYRLTCSICRACDGGERGNKVTPAIVVHGSNADKVFKGRTPLKVLKS